MADPGRFACPPKLKPMTTRFKILTGCALSFFVFAVAISTGLFLVFRTSGNPQSAARQLNQELQIEVARAESRYRSPARQRSRPEYSPISDLYDLRHRGQSGQ